MMEEPRINKKPFIILLVAVLVFSLGWFLLNYSWLTIESSSKEPKLIVVSSPEEGIIQEFEQEDSPRTLFLKRDTYDIKASQGDQFSAYRKPLGFLWFNKLELELNPQKSSEFLGKNYLPCAKDTNNNEVYFSSCGPSGEGAVIFSSTRGLLNYNQTGLITSEEEPGPAIGVLKYYEDGFLNAWVGRGVLKIIERETQKDRLLEIPDFGGEINDDIFSVSAETKKFAVYNNASNNIQVFNDLSDSNPMKLTLPEERQLPYFVNKLFISNGYIYFFSLIDYELEDHSHDEESNSEEPPDSAKQKIFIFNLESGDLEAEHSIPRDWQERDTSVGPGNQILLVVDKLSSDFKQGVIYSISGSSGLVELNTLASAPQSSCWRDENSFYYLADAGRSIYLYSLSKQASFLVYGGLVEGKFVSNIYCDQGSLHFNFDHTEGLRISPQDRVYDHFKLTDGDSTGIRLESVVPVFVAVGEDVLKGDINTRGVMVNVDIEGDNDSSTPPKDLAIREITSEIINQGVLITSDVDFFFRR